MFGLALIDILVIVAYFIVIIGIGFWSMRRIKNQEDYFLAGRRFGKFIQTFASFGQSTSADSSVMVTSTTVTNGAAGIWSALNMLFATPIYWLTCVWYRRLRLLTLGDFFEDRYQSKKMAGAYALFMSVSFMFLLSLGFLAMGKAIMSMTPKSFDQLSVAQVAEYNMAVELDDLDGADYGSLGATEKDRLAELRILRPKKVFSHIDKTMLILVVSIVVLLYAVAGGLEAAFLTDIIQGIFIIILSVLMFPFAFIKLNKIYGGEGVMDVFHTIHQRLPESFFDIMGSPKTMDFTWYYITALGVMVTINVMISANQLTASGSAKDEYTARFGFTAGVFLKRGCTVLWGFFAILILVLYPKFHYTPDMAYGHAVHDLLGPLNMGLVGLMIACLMAALMSTADCIMITSSSLLTHNLYRVVLPNKNERHYVMAGRILGAVTVLGGAWFALGFDSIFQQIKLLWELGVVFAATFWMGILWRKSNAAAAWCSILVTLIAFFVLPIVIPLVNPGLRSDPYMTRMTSPDPIERAYRASASDVELREGEIVAWDKLSTEGQADVERPAVLSVGQEYTKTYQLQRKAIFWTEGVKVGEDGVMEGKGRLNVMLLLLDKCGWDLSENPFALNETIRIIFRIVIPFGLLYVVGCFTKSRDKADVDRFYAKMKTPVLVDREADRLALEASYAEPHRHDHLKLFPKSNWEFCKWDKVDTIGFVISVLMVFAIIGSLFVLVTVGA